MQTEQSLSFYQVAQNKVDQYLQHINLSSSALIRYVSFFGIGFVIGMLFKRYGSMLISWIVGIILICLVFNYFDLIIVQKANIKFLLGFQDVQSLDDFFVALKIKFSLYSVECIIFLIAILLGFKLG